MVVSMMGDAKGIGQALRLPKSLPPATKFDSWIVTERRALRGASAFFLQSLSRKPENFVQEVLL